MYRYTQSPTEPSLLRSLFSLAIIEILDGGTYWASTGSPPSDEDRAIARGVILVGWGELVEAQPFSVQRGIIEILPGASEDVRTIRSPRRKYDQGSLTIVKFAATQWDSVEWLRAYPIDPVTSPSR